MHHFTLSNFSNLHLVNRRQEIFSFYRQNLFYRIDSSGMQRFTYVRTHSQTMIWKGGQIDKGSSINDVTQI